jgi:hypothetical protein
MGKLHNSSHPSPIRKVFKLTSLHSDTTAIGAILIIIGAIVQTFTKGGDPMLAGRFVVGLGASFEGIGRGPCSTGPRKAQAKIPPI